MILSFQEARNEKDNSVGSIKSEKISEIEDFLSKQSKILNNNK